MKYITLLFLPFLILSCDNSTSPEEEEVFEPYTNGTFYVHSPDAADWVGTRAKSFTEGDTIYYNAPDSIHAYLYQNLDFGGDGHVVFEIVDSTLNVNSFEFPWNVSLTYDPVEKYSENITMGGGSTHKRDDYTRAKFEIKHKCRDGYVDPHGLYYIIWNRNDGWSGNPLRAHQFDVAGIVQTIEDISC